MSGAKKFGAFAGVFTPSILTILGVIMYLRMGWVVGNAGILGTLVIVAAAHIISITTGLSISSIATDKKIGAGGVYYVLSRSLGLPMGGAIGLTLFVGTAFSIALYLVGFAESFNAWFDLGVTPNDLRIGASLALWAIAIIALISTAVAIKTQFIIMLFIAASLVSIFFGATDPEAIKVPFMGADSSVDPIDIFAVFFPAVTGFTAGIAMSGDLSDPKRAIPRGTLAAIAVGFVVYVALAIFLGLRFDMEELRTNNNILVDMALFAPAVVAGVWGATLSSALGGILGGPRILQAMSLDKITPKLFAKGVRKDNEPWNALFLTVIIAQAGILIGELELIARVVSMFYLAAYGFINLSFFLESWASADFNPSFKVKRWIGLVGVIVTFAIMFQLDALAMIAAVVIILGIYFWLTRTQISLGTGDIWQSVWSSVVRTGLRRMDESEDHQRNWKPNILLFSGSTKDRPYLLDFSKWLAGQTGIVTNFDLVQSSGNATPVRQQGVQDEELKRRGIFGRRIEVDNVYDGIETISGTFGFSGIEPNTVLMGWGRNTKDPIQLAQATRTLIAQDHNVLFLDYDHRFGFRNKSSIDLWWRGLGPNAGLMLDLAKFIMNSTDWSQAALKIIVVDESETEISLIEAKVRELLDARRLKAEIKIMRRSTDQASFYQLMKTHSIETDLVLVGIPKVEDEQIAEFVEHTNDLVGTIGTTLLVGASSTFQSHKIAVRRVRSGEVAAAEVQVGIPELFTPPKELANSMATFDDKLNAQLKVLQTQALRPASEYHLGLLAEFKSAYSDHFGILENGISRNQLEDATNVLLQGLVQLSRDMRENAVPEMSTAHAVSIPLYLKKCEEAVAAFPESVKRFVLPEELKIAEHDNALVKKLKRRHARRWRIWGKPRIHVPLRELAQQYQQIEFNHAVQHALNEYGAARSACVADWNGAFVQKAIDLVGKHAELRGELSKEILTQFRFLVESALDSAEQQMAACEADLAYALSYAQRNLGNNIIAASSRIDVEKFLRTDLSKRKRKSQKRKMKLAALAANWGRNRELDLIQFEAAASMKALAAKSRVQLHLLKVRTRLKYFRGICMSAKLILTQLDDIKGLSANAEWTPIKIEEHLFGASEQYLESLSATMREAQGRVPEVVELRNAAAYDSGHPKQDIGVRSFDLELDKITEHLLEHRMMAPIREKLSEVGGSMNRAQARLFGAVELLEHSLKENPEEGSALVDNARRECEQVLAGIDELSENFNEEINQLGGDLERALDIEQVILNADDLQQYVKRERRMRGLEEWSRPWRKKIVEYYKDLRALVLQRQRDEARTAFEHKYEHLNDPFSQVQAHLEALALPAELEAALPFLYKQLFRGKHLALGRELKAFTTEMAQAKKALERMEGGASGAMMVLGESGSGRSFFCEHLATNLLDGRIFRIEPPTNFQRNANSLQRALAKALEAEGSSKEMLAQLPKGAILLFNDLEKWWLRSDDEHAALNELAELIAEYGSKHHFLLNCSRHSYMSMRQYSTLQDQIAATINLAPLSADELREVVFERQRSSGLGIIHKGRAVNLERDDVLGNQFRRLRSLSGGNIGLAFRIWLNSLEQMEGNELTLGPLRRPDFPSLQDHIWKGVIYQFILHNSLSREDVFTLFGDHGREQLVRVLGNMRRSGLMKENEEGTLYLNEAQRPYIEQWMKTLEILQ